MKISAERELDYPIVFVADPANPTVEAPEVPRGHTVAATENTVAVIVRSYVDGSVKLTLLDEPPSSDQALFEVFAGVVHTPTKRLAIIAPPDEQLLSAVVTAEKTAFEVFVDDREHASDLYVLLKHQESVGR